MYKVVTMSTPTYVSEPLVIHFPAGLTAHPRGLRQTILLFF